MTRSTATPSAPAGEVPPRVSSGFPESDAQSDFTRARRARLLADIGRRLRREPDDVALMLPFEEVVEALGRTGQHDLGLQVVPLDAIVGTVDRGVDFDRGLRPTSRSEEHTSELQSQSNLVCRLLLEKKKRFAVREVNHPVAHFF